MKIKTYLLRGIACVCVLSCFTMCTKKINPLEESPGAAPVSKSSIDIDIAGDNLVTSAADLTANCGYTVQPNQWFVDGAGIPAGSTICIPAGTRGSLLFKNLKGNALQIPL
jgi:hypothetical protein